MILFIKTSIGFNIFAGLFQLIVLYGAVSTGMDATIPIVGLIVAVIGVVAGCIGLKLYKECFDQENEQ